MDDGSACVACPCPCPCRPAGTAEYYLAPTACLEDPEVGAVLAKLAENPKVKGECFVPAGASWPSLVSI
jgi:hypothetical protein